ncbi:hypothetical protein M409DRAFT_57990 [Zasmidium cellare ATCC 36951]|uniref:Uncharacterized protein n=1 Tax=Zasmidium cellare ATCC 36951 TaxID=1080233 RepID=A0A6A6C7C7_ZASCE|nr:uncharacterized protein M409DRAFT_57990 [Zasmidium cellare ATCC 36951]KAF2162951.1 hypothetical protein M409DRAFT_57990 [Zasmidium cellare ATCC 36951]
MKTASLERFCEQASLWDHNPPKTDGLDYGNQRSNEAASQFSTDTDTGDCQPDYSTDKSRRSECQPVSSANFVEILLAPIKHGLFAGLFQTTGLSAIVDGMFDVRFSHASHAPPDLSTVRERQDTIIAAGEGSSPSDDQVSKTLQDRRQPQNSLQS